MTAPLDLDELAALVQPLDDEAAAARSGSTRWPAPRRARPARRAHRLARRAQGSAPRTRAGPVVFRRRARDRDGEGLGVPAGGDGLDGRAGLLGRLRGQLAGPYGRRRRPAARPLGGRDHPGGDPRVQDPARAAGGSTGRTRSPWPRPRPRSGPASRSPTRRSTAAPTCSSRASSGSPLPPWPRCSSPRCTDSEPVKVIGRGSGIDDRAWMRKVVAIRDALRRARPFAGDPLALLARRRRRRRRRDDRLPRPGRGPAHAGAAGRRAVRGGRAGRAARSRRTPRPGGGPRTAPPSRRSAIALRPWAWSRCSTSASGRRGRRRAGRAAAAAGRGPRLRRDAPPPRRPTCRASPSPADRRRTAQPSPCRRRPGRRRSADVRRHERRLDHAHRRRPAADVDHHLVALAEPGRGGEQGQADALLQRRRERPAGHLADRGRRRPAPAMCGRGMPRSSASRPHSSRAGPASFSASSASRPQNAGFFQPTAQPEPGLHRGDLAGTGPARAAGSPSRCAACPGRPARHGAHAERPAPAVQQRVPQRAGLPGRRQQLVPVLAGVAGPADDQLVAVPARRPRSSCSRARSAGPSRAEQLGRARPLHGEHAVSRGARR